MSSAEDAWVIGELGLESNLKLMLQRVVYDTRW